MSCVQRRVYAMCTDRDVYVMFTDVCMPSVQTKVMPCVQTEKGYAMCTDRERLYHVYRQRQYAV